MNDIGEKFNNGVRKIGQTPISRIIQTLKWRTFSKRIVKNQCKNYAG